jgi:DNA polymerase III alpha subunit
MSNISVEDFNRIVHNQFKKFPFHEDPRYQFRLRYELLEIETQNCCDYFINLVKQRKKFSNENNLLVPVLLGICNEFNIAEMPKTKTNEFPDVDIDFLADVRDYLKNVYAPNQYKPENTCSIGTYGRYALKSAMLDMARIFGYDRQEALNITTSLRMKDEDGDELPYEEALEMYPELKSYMDKYPELALAVQKLLNRVRNTGKHAGGVIVAKDQINKFVPLMKTTGGDLLVSQFVEGLATQELGPIGLVKFDLLVVSALEQTAHAVKMIKERHDIKVICGNTNDWDNTDYLNDKQAISNANESDLIGIFQYDSNGIREVVKASGIDSFDDLVAIVSLYRPGPLNAEMDQVFIKRRTGQEEYKIHPVLEPILKSTYGIIIYQEQVMRILNVVGKIPLKDCETIRKAISKKKISSFIKYKEQFIENGINVLQITREEVAEIFQNIEFFSAYGFNLSHATAYTYISSRQLYLKTYYPLEFFTALLMLEGSEDKKRIYITDAQNHNIEVKPVDLNKSKANFSIYENAIYMGFGNVKGIGIDTANKIVALQPFQNIDDFLRRFGTDSSVLKALIPLKVFGEDTKRVYKYWQSFLLKNKKVVDKNKRANKSYNELKKSVLSYLPEKYWNLDLSEELFQILRSINKTSDVEKLYKKWMRMIKKEEAKIEISYEEFDDEDFAIEDKEVLLELVDIFVAERKHYGFQFTCRLQTKKMYNKNLTFSKVIDSHAMGANKHMVQIEVLDVNKRYSKAGKTYCQILAMDSEFRIERINIWEDDYSIFRNLLEVNNCLSVQVKPPSNGFSTFGLNSPAKNKRYLLPSSEMDFRIVLMD